MQETEPLYFTKFREHIDNKLETHVPAYFKEFREYIEQRLDKIDNQLVEVNDKLDYHFEEIGELKVEVTKTNLLLVKKADQKDLERLEKRTDKLEKLAFV